MRKFVILQIILLFASVSVSLAALGDANDGYLTASEYDYAVEVENSDRLIVMGGGHIASQ